MNSLNAQWNGVAVEAVIWGMPAVNYDLMLQEMLNKTDGKVNHTSDMSGARHPPHKGEG
jgi:hypothetical protein